MIIAIIDDGINPSYYPNIGQLKYDFEVTSDLEVKLQSSLKDPPKSHGTVCASIIKKYAPTVEIISIKIMSIGKNGTKGQLIQALTWCLSHEISLIHMSIGSTYFADFDEIRRVTDQLIDGGCIIVAAYSNDGAYTVPACLPGVIGVKALEDPMDRSISIHANRLDNAMILAPAHHELISDSGKKETSIASNSYAAPFVTALINNYMEGHPKWSLTDVVSHLYKEADMDPDESLFMPRPDLITADIRRIFTEQEGALFSLGDKKLLSLWHKGNSLLLLPRDDGAIAIPRLDRSYIRENNISRILYAGRASEATREELRCLNCFLWDEGIYANFLTHLDHDGDTLSIPIVLCYGNDIQDLYLANTLRDWFLSDGFHAKTVSDLPQAYLYDVNYLPPGNDAKIYFKHIQNTLLCDIIIYISKTKNVEDELIDIRLASKQHKNTSEYDYLYDCAEDLTQTYMLYHSILSKLYYDYEKGISR